MKIDAIITWVDGNDPVLREKILNYAPEVFLKHDDIAGETRYANVGEIYLSIASLNRFAPFLNKIYIITDNQNPHLEDFLERNFPQGHIPVEIVDHKVIFKGYENYLPVFNSGAIETMPWRIPELSEHFIILNDDFILINPISESDLFDADGNPVCYADFANIPLTLFTRAIKKKSDGLHPVTFKGRMVKAAIISGARWRFLQIGHTPRPLLKSVYQEILGNHPELIIQNIRHRFRHLDQFNSETYQYMYLYRSGRCKDIRPVNDYLIYIQPNGKQEYIIKKYNKLKKQNHKFCCINSIEKATLEERKLIINELCKILNITI